MSDASNSEKEVVCATIRLLEDLLHCMSHTGLMRRPDGTDDGTGLQKPFKFACTFYKLPLSDLGLPVDESSMSSTPFASCFQSLVSLSSVYARCIRDREGGSVFRDPFCRILGMLGRLVERLDAVLTVSWDPKIWLDDLLSTFHSKVCEELICNVLELIMNSFV